MTQGFLHARYWLWSGFKLVLVVLSSLRDVDYVRVRMIHGGRARGI